MRKNFGKMDTAKLDGISFAAVSNACVRMGEKAGACDRDSDGLHSNSL